MIIMEDVCFEYENKTKALNHVNLKIENSEFVFIIGDSGAGKSSIFKLITREQLATTGKVIVNKQDLSKISRKKLPFFKRKIGMVFQDFRLLDNMTIFDNVAFVLRVTGYSNNYIKQRVPRVLELVSLSHKADKMPHEISGGEQQRVAIARAIASNPPILIADEPTGNIDPDLSYQIMKILFDLNKYLKVTTIVVTHEHDMVRHFGKRIIKINKGQVEFDKIVNKDTETYDSANPAINKTLEVNI